MENPVSLQAGLFFSCFVLGMIIGAFYIIPGALGRKKHFWLACAADIILGLLSGPAVFLFLMGLNGGDVRGYLLAAVLFGGCLVSVGWYFLFRKKKGKKRRKEKG